MLDYPVLITSEFQLKIIIRSKDGHNAQLLTTIHQLEAKPNNHSYVIFSIL